ncbi:GNAT family N-acetyltransferase [Streptomyces uncialis]|uniref:GNAT family N-acetyltransferase n=1 Tax=Streptomyces uncialis TaxID=1048205 RepID=UPI002E33503B|nr:GNAT family N-acetyltransferase [Streptomyces uncialis]
MVIATCRTEIDWPMLSAGSRHTLSESWLSVADGRLPESVGIALVDDGTQVAMMGRVVPTATDNQFLDPYLPAAQQLGNPERIFPAMAFMYPNYDAYPIGPGSAAPRRLAEFVFGVERLATERGMRSVVFQYLGPESDLLVDALTNAKFQVYTVAQRAELSIEFAGIGDYLSGFPKRRRDKIKHEIRVMSEAGVAFSVRHLQEDEKPLIDLRCALVEKYRGKSDSERERGWFDKVQRSFPGEDIFVVTAEADGHTLGFTLFVRTADRLTALLTGTDYHHPRADYVYFGTSFYAAIPLAVEVGTRVIEYGMGSEQAKQSRGCLLSPLRWAVRDLSGEVPAAVRRV